MIGCPGKTMLEGAGHLLGRVLAPRRLACDTLELVASPVVHERVTGVRDHRPWPMPARSWIMAQSWLDLLFAHWSVPPDELSAVVPPQLTLDTRDGRAWIAVTPFAVRNLRLRPTLPVPMLSSFLEINVRTYVRLGGKPCIYFFSLDASSTSAVAAARRFYRLPYFHAQMAMWREGPWFRFTSERTGPEDDAPPATFGGRYRSTGPPAPPPPGSLEEWLTERYGLYTLDERGRVLRGDIHHPPWPLQPAAAELDTNTMTAQIGVGLGGQPLLHYSARQDVVFWSLEEAGE